MFVFQAHGLRKLRLNAGVTQRDLATHLGYSTVQFISNIETGKANIPNHDIPAIAKALDVQAKEIAALKVLDILLKLSQETKAPQLKKYAKLIAKNEKSLRKLITEKKLGRYL